MGRADQIFGRSLRPWKRVVVREVARRAVALGAMTLLSLLVAVAAAVARTATATVTPFRLHVLQKSANFGSEAPDPQNLYELCAVDAREALGSEDFDGVCGGVDKVTLALGLEGDARANLHFDLLYSSGDPFQVVLLGECTAAAVGVDQKTVTVLFDISVDQVLRVSSPGGLSDCPSSYDLRDPSVFETYCTDTARLLAAAKDEHASFLRTTHADLEAQFVAIQDACSQSSTDTAAVLTQQRERCVQLRASLLPACAHVPVVWARV